MSCSGERLEASIPSGTRLVQDWLVMFWASEKRKILNSELELYKDNG